MVAVADKAVFFMNLLHKKGEVQGQILLFQITYMKSYKIITKPLLVFVYKANYSENFSDS